MQFPLNRMKRLRKSKSMRNLVSETVLTVNDLVMPMFVKDGNKIKEPISSMDSICCLSPDMAVTEATEIASLGIKAVLLFGQARKKDKNGSDAWADDGPVQKTIKAIKKQVPDLVVMTDVCLCGYTEDGHCGIVNEQKQIDNDKSCELLAKIALSHAMAGADVVAPSDMNDGNVLAVRQMLEAKGFKDVAIMAYSAKYASCFYGPFREAADSAAVFGDRKSYQMDPANAKQAICEVKLDVTQGADIVMIKPALCYLDIVAKVRQAVDCPVAAYNVSGEFMMINAAARQGLIDKNQAIIETLVSIKRAGADIIITYFAKEAAELLK